MGEQCTKKKKKKKVGKKKIGQSEIAIWWASRENWAPVFLSSFFSYQTHQNIIFSPILSIILKVYPTKQTSVEKSSISLY